MLGEQGEILKNIQVPLIVAANLSRCLRTPRISKLLDQHFAFTRTTHIHFTLLQMTTEDMKEQRSGAELPWELWKLISRRTALVSGKKQLHLSKRHLATAPSSFTCPTDPALAKQLGFVRAKRPHPCVCLPLKSIFCKGLCW